MYRLIYKSRASQRINWKFVQELVTNSERSNKDAGITGVLIASDSHFLQVLEGEYSRVNDLFMRIVRDSRHEHIQLISFSCVEKRLFSEWAMHGAGIFDFNSDLVTNLIDCYGEEEGSVRFPLEDWKALALIRDLRMA